jgi:hypothetical protein
VPIDESQMIFRLTYCFSFSHKRKKERQVFPLNSHQFESLEVFGDVLSQTPNEEESTSDMNNFRFPELLFQKDDYHSIHLFYYNQLNYATRIGQQQSNMRSLSIQKSNL